VPAAAAVAAQWSIIWSFTSFLEAPITKATRANTPNCISDAAVNLKVFEMKRIEMTLYGLVATCTAIWTMCDMYSFMG